MNHYRPHMLPKVRSKAIMASANGKPCTGRVSSYFPGHTCASEETTLLCHFDSAGGKGTSTKVTDLGGAYLCKHCDDIFTGIDQKRSAYIREKHPSALGERAYKSLVETHAMMIEDGIIVVPDGRIVR